MSAAKKVEVRLRPYQRVEVDGRLALPGEVVKVPKDDADALIAEGYAETPGSAAAHEAAEEAVAHADHAEAYAEGLRALVQRSGDESDREYAEKAAAQAADARAEADRLLAVARDESGPPSDADTDARAVVEDEQARAAADEAAREARGEAEQRTAEREAVEGNRERNALDSHDPAGA